MSFIDGFFDNIPINVNAIDIKKLLDQTQDQTGKLWTKPNKKIIPTEENVLLEISLGKKKDSQGNISERLFFITRTHLVYAREGS